MVRHNQIRDTVSYDALYDSLVQFEPHVLASKAKKVAKNHDPLALLAHSNASSSQSHANSSYSPQPYYFTHPTSVVDYKDEYQGELQGDSQEDKLITAMIVDIQTKNAGYGGNSNRNVGKQNRNQAFNARNGYDDSNQIVQRKPKVRDAKYFREKMLLAMKDESGSNLNDEGNDLLLDNSYRDETMEELTVAVIGCSKRMTGNLQLLRNFVKKFKGLVRFKNDHFAAITGYGDYVQDEAPDMIIDFINQVQRNLKAQILMIQTDNGTEFNNEKLWAFYAKLGIVHKTSIARAPQQKGVVKRRNRTLVEAAQTILISGTFNHYPSRKPRKLWSN
uniref:Ribonuclease H-like domain-containing protein n=1 Tax=Tanacetum cinerariifolium TaxID=118510 RepID=A0A699I3U5_TANCI|nr:ribonuclease H-like domain-containing protein [Tanacetum cinerariifolium]